MHPRTHRDIVVLKGFDTVFHSRPRIKLSQSPMLVRHNTLFKGYPATSGDTYGSVSFFFLLIFMNDLPCNLFSIRLFADDCVIHRDIDFPTDGLFLHADLNIMLSWCSNWFLSHNIDKRRYIAFSRSRYPAVNISVFKYLGINLSSNLFWSGYVNRIVKRVMSPLSSVKRNLKLAPHASNFCLKYRLSTPEIEYV